jgi:hypothetical protein
MPPASGVFYTAGVFTLEQIADMWLRAADVGANLRRGEQLDHDRTVLRLGLAQHEPLGPDRRGWPSDRFQLRHDARLTS